jgi:hypothetical protein
MNGKFVILERYWTDDKDSQGSRIYVGVVKYEGQGRFNGQIAEVRIPHNKHINSGKALDDMVNKANHGLGHVQGDLKIKDMEEFMRKKLLQKTYEKDF